MPARPPVSRQLRRPRSRRALIGLTPLIDVVFILLVFFMLASSFVDWRGVQLTPSASGKAGPDVRQAVLIRVSPGGGVDINGEAIEGGAIAARLEGLRRGEADLRVLIQPLAGVPLQDALDVFDTVSAAGLEEVEWMRAPGTRP